MASLAVGCARQTSPIYRGPAPQLKRLKGSVAEIVADTTAHLQGSGGLVCLNGSRLFWQQEQDQNSIRQVVKMLRLIGANALTEPHPHHEQTK